MAIISTDRLSRRAFLGAGTIALAASACRAAPQALPTFRPEDFGARGDGLTNDSAAFAELAKALSRHGGGTIALRPTTYIVGMQRRVTAPNAGYAFAPAPLLHFRRLQGALVIEGNGARLRCSPGGRYGTFDPATGEPAKSHPMPYLNPAARATPYEYMILAEECAGDVTISDLELDGNVGTMIIGGAYGDSGIQIAGTGIFLRNNRGSEILRNIHSHHHPQDGLMIDGSDDIGLAARVTRRAQGVRSEYNGRQGASLVGGRGWTFSGCRFNHTGRGPISSAPGAGFDIEAEGGKTNRNHRFEDCEFADNSGCGLVADSGDSEDVRFERCRFVGTTSWSLWPNKPLFRFNNCTVIGSAVKCYGDVDPRRAAHFNNCTFTDDPKQSPSGKVYREGRPDGALVDAGESANPYFQDCRFLAVGGGVLPWSIHATYVNCTMKQTSRSPGYPRGSYVGSNRIDSANIDLYGVKIRGELVLNGKRYHP